MLLTYLLTSYQLDAEISSSLSKFSQGRNVIAV
jgi:hypothetical protein